VVTNIEFGCGVQRGKAVCGLFAAGKGASFAILERWDCVKQWFKKKQRHLHA
jgi:hypothetical protein